jgi:hypothetical protein
MEGGLRLMWKWQYSNTCDPNQTANRTRFAAGKIIEN